MKYAQSPLWPNKSGRSPHGERGLKLSCPRRPQCLGLSRSPHGERGLKSQCGHGRITPSTSLPSRGAWIEIAMLLGCELRTKGSLPSRGAWIEMRCPCLRRHGCRLSLPSRGAWIENGSCINASDHNVRPLHIAETTVAIPQVISPVGSIIYDESSLIHGIGLSLLKIERRISPLDFYYNFIYNVLNS